MRVELDRSIHPIAWWLWALGFAVAITRTTNILLIVLGIAITIAIVANFRSDAPWSRAFSAALTLGAIILSIRLIFALFLGVSTPGNTLFTIPQVSLPDWMAGIRIGGPVTSERLGTALSEGMLIVALIAITGAATALSHPRRLLRTIPGALHEAGVAVVVATTFTPQLVMSIQRVREARRLRGHELTGWRGIRGLALPVLEDALERAMALAGAMESRGYGRSAASPPHRRRLLAGLMLTGLGAMVVGLYGLLSVAPTPFLGAPLVVIGTSLCIATLHLSGKRTLRTKYRPDPWGAAEWLIISSAFSSALLMILISGRGIELLSPAYNTTALPQLPLLATAALAITLLPALALSEARR
jgi:energy-coupling factor transport system permease protein